MKYLFSSILNYLFLNGPILVKFVLKRLSNGHIPVLKSDWFFWHPILDPKYPSIVVINSFFNSKRFVVINFFRFGYKKKKCQSLPNCLDEDLNYRRGPILSYTDLGHSCRKAEEKYQKRHSILSHSLKSYIQSLLPCWQKRQWLQISFETDQQNGYQVESATHG